jgi:citrate lyase beta subunit
MRHHGYNPGFEFVQKPMEFDKNTERDVLQYCLGATLYMPGTKKITEKLMTDSIPGLTSMVMCFEDAIKAKELPEAESNVLSHLSAIAEAVESRGFSIGYIPLTFLRVRSVEQFKYFALQLKSKHASALTGFVFPKFNSDNGYDYLETLKDINRNLGVQLYGMPILEGRTLAYAELRIDELGKLKSLLEAFKELILNIRVGGTDFSSIFGVRRGINYSIYDILTVRDCIADILNFFNREGAGYTLSAPVWEYFLADKEDDLQHLLDEDIHHSILRRNPILNDAVDGLLREVILDKANGFIGKTIIHPSHLRYVNAMQAVSLEAFEDASQILGT